MKSKFLTLDWKDFPVLIAGVSGALAYLLKCLMTNSQDQMFKREPVTA